MSWILVLLEHDLNEKFLGKDFLSCVDNAGTFGKRSTITMQTLPEARQCFNYFASTRTGFDRQLPGCRNADSCLHGSLEPPISFTLMVHHVVLYKLKPEVTPARVETMMMNTRMQLLKIPEVLSIKCGKRIDSEVPWPFFIAIDFESMDKYAIFREDSIFVKFTEEVIKPNTEDSLVLDFEMDPGKDVRFS